MDWPVLFTSLAWGAAVLAVLWAVAAIFVYATQFI
jgi:hypothetical protein